MSRVWVLGTVASMLLHGGVAAAFLVTLATRPGQPVEHGETGAIAVTLISASAISQNSETRPVAETTSADTALNPAVASPSEASTPSSATRTATPGATASAQAAAPNPGALSEYYRQLEDHLARFHRYPAMAASPRPSGMVRVSLIVQRDGRVLDAWIETSSGVVMLDDAALRTLRQAEPLPVLPATLPGPIDLVVPLRYAAGARNAG